MNAYTMHILDGRRWRQFERFADRDSAMVVASRIRNTGEYTGVKIIETVVDRATRKAKQNIVYAWTTKSKEMESYEVSNDYIGRVKNTRIEKAKKEERKRRARNKRIRDSCVTGLVVCVFLAGVYTLYLLKNS